MQPTKLDPLSYHGTDKIYEWSDKVHSFWQYPSYSKPFDTRWDTHNAAKFCTNFDQKEQNWRNDLIRFECKGHATMTKEQLEALAARKLKGDQMMAAIDKMVQAFERKNQDAT